MLQDLVPTDLADPRLHTEINSALVPSDNLGKNF